MTIIWYQFLNIFFFVFHTVFTLFNVLGWISIKTRRVHLVTLLLTAFSWFVLGIWYGWGYCACTHWHWLVRQKLGYDNPSNSYIHFLIRKITGLNLNEHLVEMGTLVVFIVSTVLSITLNIRDYRRKKRQQRLTATDGI